MIFYFQLRGADYEDLTMIKSEIFYCIKISKKLSKIICFMQNHELLVFYCGHQSKVHRQKWVSTNRQLIVANLIYITLQGALNQGKKCMGNKFHPNPRGPPLAKKFVQRWQHYISFFKKCSNSKFDTTLLLQNLLLPLLSVNEIFLRCTILE